MFRGLPAAFLLSCFTFSAFAYTVGQQLTITNNTDKDMQIAIDQVNNQAAVSQLVPAHETVSIYTENGDKSGWLNQFAAAPFKITDAKSKVAYVTGNIAFYVTNGLYKYSFLNSVAGGKGMTLEANYSCQSGFTGTVFQNKIILNGNPSAAVETHIGDPRRCEGLVESTLDKSHQVYTAICSDNTQKIYHQYGCEVSNIDKNGHVVHTDCTWRREGGGYFFPVCFTDQLASDVLRCDLTEESLSLVKKTLDQFMGYRACGSQTF